jgi:cobalt-zinc-cadmium resistance protein CzcA
MPWGARSYFPERLHEVMVASREMIRPSVFGQGHYHHGVSAHPGAHRAGGKMFHPMAMTVIFALAAAFVLSLTFVPAMVALCISGRCKKRKRARASGQEGLCTHSSAGALRLRWLVVPVAIAALSAALALSALGQELCPYAR